MENIGIRPEEYSEEYTQSEIDRGIGFISYDFIDREGEPMLGVMYDIHEAKGEITYLDAGCGTGRALFEAKEQLARGRNTESVHGYGVTDTDFSDKAEEWVIREAIKNREVKYIVQKLEDYRPKERFDLIYSYMVLMHTENPTSILRNLWEALNSDGRLYFELDLDQTETADFKDFLEEVEGDADIFGYVSAQKNWVQGDEYQKIFFVLRKLSKKAD